MLKRVCAVLALALLASVLAACGGGAAGGGARAVTKVGKRVAMVNPHDFSTSDAVAIMTGAMAGEEVKRD